jgi:putative transposase
MRRSRFSEAQIVGMLKEAELGKTVEEVCRSHGISAATFYKWRSKYGGLEASDLKKMRELEQQHSQLKRMYADLAMENNALKDLIEKKL